MEYDLIIIGSGIAGSSFLYLAQKVGFTRIAVIDKGLIGGEISRFGGAANLIFGENEKLQLNISSEKYIQEIHEKGAPIFKINSRIYTKKESKIFPYAIHKNNYLEQPAYIGNPSEIAQWLCKETSKNTDYYTCTNVENINSLKKTINLSTGIILRYKILVLATGNYLPRIDGIYRQIITTYKKLCVLNILAPFLPKNYLHFFADEDSYCFPDKITGQTIFCYPTNKYISDISHKLDFTLQKEDVDFGQVFIKKISMLKDSKIYGGRIFYEGYTENRTPRIEPFEKNTNIFLLNTFSGSGLRLSFGASEKILSFLGY